MSYEFVQYEKRGRIAYITLNRPQVMNALHLEAHLELKEVWEDFRDDPDAWVAILTGAGERAFCAGTTSRSRPRERPTEATSMVARDRRSAGSPAISTARSR
jgi:enoyl-CoA hydratase/carnithine racemase